MISQLETFLSKNKQITMTAEYINLDCSDKKYSHDNWKITFDYEGKQFSPDVIYKTGIGYRVPNTVYPSAIKKERG